MATYPISDQLYQALLDAIPEESGDTNMSTAEELRREADEAEDRARRLRREARTAELAAEEASRPKMPHIEMDGSRVILFEKYQSGRNYAFAAVGWRPGGTPLVSTRWVVTGNDGIVRHNWKSLLNFIGKANWATIRVVTATSPLLAPGDEPAVAERMGRYGKPAGLIDHPFTPGGMYDNEY